MSRLMRMCRVLAHPRELRMALSGLAVRLGGDEEFGGVSADELSALVEWVRQVKPSVFVEIGTLFGFTARSVARQTGVRVVAVDNFSWNPFGLTPAQHEAFARRVVEGCDVELVRADSRQFLSDWPLGDAASAMVFLDGDHSYDGVRAELELLKAKGVAVAAGHDFGRAGFGVAQAVRDVLGEPDEVSGICWMKRIAR